MLQLTTPVAKFTGALGSFASLMLGTLCMMTSAAQSAHQAPPSTGIAAESSSASPIYGVTIPAGYRDWKLIALNHLDTDKVHQLRAQLGNDIAIKAFKAGTLPFPDGAIIAALHWNQVTSEESDRLIGGVFPGAHSVFAGEPANVQFMVKDSKKYAATGGWGFADFRDGKPSDRSVHEACFACHVPAKAHDYVFARYAKAP
jgi:hypothetical protein